MEETRMPLSTITQSTREAERLESDDLLSWYRDELSRIRRLANTDSPEVRHTLSWSIPWFEAVLAGREPPARPPKKPARKSATRFLDVVAPELPERARRKKLTLSGGAA